MTAPTPDTEAIAEALHRATPGPWEYRVHDSGDRMESHYYTHRVEAHDPCKQVCEFDVAFTVRKRQADAHLIANAPTWLAQLLAALEAAEEERDEALATVRLWAPIVDAIRHPTAGDDAEVEYEAAHWIWKAVRRD